MILVKAYKPFSTDYRVFECLSYERISREQGGYLVFLHFSHTDTITELQIGTGHHQAFASAYFENSDGRCFDCIDYSNTNNDGEPLVSN